MMAEWALNLGHGANSVETSWTFQLQNYRWLAKLETLFWTIPSRFRIDWGIPNETSKDSLVLPRGGSRCCPCIHTCNRGGKKSYDSVLGKFDSFFKVRKNVIFEQARFKRRNQLDGESAEQYIMELYTLAENCDFNEMKDEMIRDRLVVGIKDSVLSERLQLDSNLTLETAKKAIHQREAVQEQQLQLLIWNLLMSVYRGKCTHYLELTKP